MLFLRVIAWCGDEKFSLKKSCFYLYIRRRHEPRRNPPADSRRMGTVRTSPQKPYVHQMKLCELESIEFVYVVLYTYSTA